MQETRSARRQRKHQHAFPEGSASRTRSLRSTTTFPSPLSLPKLHSTLNSSHDVATASTLEVESVPTETATFRENLEARREDHHRARRLNQAEPDKDLTGDSHPKIAQQMAIVGDPSYVQVHDFGRSKARKIKVCILPSHVHVQHDKDPTFSDEAKLWITTITKNKVENIRRKKSMQ